MERKIGEIFEYNGEWYQCLKSPDGSCKYCDMNFGSKCPIPIKECAASPRSDLSYVIFKKLEKIGEPFTVKGKEYQRYITHVHPYIYNKLNSIPLDASSILIEVKQNKEDMKEKKPTYEELLHYYHSTVGLWAIDKNPREKSLDWICDNAFQLGIDEKDSNSENIGKNLKEFDINLAKQGKPVCTRDGSKARIICFDKRDSIHPIVALIDNKFTGESTRFYSIDGKDSISDQYDLFMEGERREAWIKILRDKDGNRKIVDKLYKTKAEAEIDIYLGCVANILIKWEE